MKKDTPTRASSAVEAVLDAVAHEAKRVMDRVGLTDEDMSSIPQGLSFEEFSKHLDEIMAKKGSRS